MIHNFCKKYGLIIVLAIGVLVYSNTITHDFVYDDVFFTARKELRNIQYLPTLFLESYLPNNKTVGVYRPLTVLTFAANYIFFGEPPISFHITNIVLHLGVTWLLYKVARKLHFSIELSLLTALLFVLHPIHVEAVTYVKARDEILYSLFFLLSWLITLRVEDDDDFSIQLSVVHGVLFFLALLAKETSITIPIICCCILLRRKISRIRILFQCGIWFGFLVIYIILRSIALGNNFIGTLYSHDFVGNMLYTASLGERILTSIQIYFIYIRSLVYPVYLSATYGFAQLVPVSKFSFQNREFLSGIIVLVISLILLIIMHSKKVKTGRELVLFWFIVYLPISQLIFPQGDIVAERWMYLPSIIFILFLSWSISQIKNLRAFLVFISIPLFLLLAIRTYVRNKVWATKLTLYENMVLTAPQSVQAHTILAQEYFTRGNSSQSKEQANIAEQIYPDYAPLQNLLGTIAIKENRDDDALKYFAKSLKIFPDSLQTYSWLGTLYYKKGDYQDALRQFEFVIVKKKNLSSDDVFAYASTLVKLQRYDEGLTSLNLMKKEEMNTLRVQLLTAYIWYQQGKIDQSMNAPFWGSELTKEMKIKKLLEF